MRHLTRRFVGSLWPAGPNVADDRWARSQLLADEQALWSRMTRPDRRHSVAVARDVERRLQGEASRPVLAAALLHDVGKLDSGLGTYGRVVATLCAKVAGREAGQVWSQGRGFTRRVGLYLRHDELGAQMLELAGSDALTVAWAREHHRPREQWTVPPLLAEALHASDGD